MSENDNENDDSLKVTDDDTDNSQDNSVADTDDVETLKEKLDKQTQQNVKLFERAKKAEGYEKQPDGSWVKVQKKPEAVQAKPAPVQTESFDLEDVAVLVQKVSSKEDRELVKDYAKFKKISLEDALNNPIVQAELKDRMEKRQTANATSTGTARRGSTKPTDEQILSNIEQGKFPENAEDLAEARFSAKRKK